jgi:hypothetical protein
VPKAFSEYGRQRDLYISICKSTSQPNTAVLYELNLDSRMAPPITAYERGEGVLDCHRGSADCQYAALAFPQRRGALGQRIGFSQQGPAPKQQIGARGRKLNPAPDAVEERYPELVLQSVYATRYRWLGKVQPSCCPMHPAGIGDGDKGAQIPEVHD